MWPFVLLRQLCETTQRVPDMPQAHPRNCGGSIAKNEEGAGQRHGFVPEKTPLSRLVSVKVQSQPCSKTQRTAEKTPEHIHVVVIAIIPVLLICIGGRGVMTDDSITRVDFIADSVQGRISEGVSVTSENLTLGQIAINTKWYICCVYRCLIMTFSRCPSIHRFILLLIEEYPPLPLMVRYDKIWSLMESWSICKACMRMMVRTLKSDICDSRGHFVAKLSSVVL